MLARISWTLLHWLLSLTVISELYCLGSEFCSVFKILVIPCLPKVKDVIYFMNRYPLLKWEWSASLVLRKGACLAQERHKMRLQDRVSLDPMISRQRTRRNCIYLEMNIRKSAFIHKLQWIADWVDLAPELIMNPQPAAGQMNLLCAFILSCCKKSTWSFTWYHKQRSDLQSWNLLGEKCSALLSWMWWDQDLTSLSWCASKYSGQKFSC